MSIWEKANKERDSDFYNPLYIIRIDVQEHTHCWAHMLAENFSGFYQDKLGLTKYVATH